MAGEVADKDVILQNLDKLRNEEEYCDVTIVTDSGKFRCHRFVLAATSGYFNSLFKSSFADSTAPEISVEKVDTELFRDILKYFYTGEMIITLENAYDVLKCSDYFVIPNLKENCMEFIGENPRVDNALKICCFASSAGDLEFLKDVIENAAINFLQIIQKDDFLDTEFELLQSILANPMLNRPYCEFCNEEMIIDENQGNHNKDEVWSCENCKKEIVKKSMSDENIMCSRFADWVMHRIFERLKYFPKLSKYLNVGAKCVDKWEAIISKFASEVSPLIHDLVVRKTVYVQAVTESKHLVNFSWDNNDDCWIMYEHFEYPFQNVKGTVIAQNQYFLSVKSSEDGIINQFWVGEERSQWNELQSPPDSGKKFKLASVKNSVYLYMFNQTLIRNYNSLPCADFESVPSSVNIYTYAVDWNKWFSIPPLPKPLFHSYFVSANDMLFVIGGSTSFSLSGTHEKIIQCFDPYTSQWTERSLDVNLTLLGEACGYDAKIFICEDTETDSKVSLDTRKIYTYDVVSNEWDTVTVKKSANCNVTAVVVRDDCLWIFPDNVDCCIETFNLKSKVLNQISKIPSSVESDSGILKILAIFTALVV